jgi:hypothetical protein
MKHATRYNQSDNVKNFKKLYMNGDYRGSGQIVLSGWGNRLKPLDEVEIQEIEEFIKQTPSDRREEYDNVFKGLTGTFS